MTHLLVIGSPSLDTIHTKDQTFETLGGAGLYMSMAAHRSGVDVSMFGPRPDPVPDVLNPFSKRLKEWIGPSISPDEIPHFEISHNNEKADYLKCSVDVEIDLDLNTLPKDLSDYDGVHITAMGDADVQQALLTACRERGAKLISLGTWITNIKVKTDTVKRSLENADVFFMNEEEAVYLFGSVDNAHVQTGQILYITMADKGALVIQGDFRTHINAAQTRLVDPTGAGETFCGAVMANLLLGMHPITAGQRASVLAAEEIAHIGPTALLKDDLPPVVPLDERVCINKEQVEKVSAVVKTLSYAGSFNFVSDYLPPADHPNALDYFFAVTLQQFSFWEDDGSRYTKPLISQIDGTLLKGSAYLYYAFTRKLKKDPLFFTPERQAQITEHDLLVVFRADDGTDPMPAIDLHVQQANQYGRDMLAMGLTPVEMMARAQDSPMPLKSFMMKLDHIGGYKEDPIRKKSDLLALSLSQRPEKFFKFGANETVAPVVDYHCMRSCLRIGLIDVMDSGLNNKLAGREILSKDEEWAVRFAAYHIQEQVEALSGKPIGAVDWFFFNYMRSHCPEMTDLICKECAVDAVCAHRKEMFQPVLRTTFY
ncbi:MAG: carbohydrate kinase family protein [Pelolinea sp.]|nr:carbohydrate kinase family protein [Pelolinea sp.]